ncbi:MAG: glycosyltransferase [Bacteroidota bacterium]
MKNRLKIALVHDWLTGMRGGEKVLEVLCELYPEAALFTLLHNKGTLSETIENMKIRTSFIDKLPSKERKYRSYLPLFPIAIETFDFSEYDLVISTSHCVAKNVKVKNGLHICYCHTPMRYVWEMFDEYFGKGKAGFVTRTAMKIAAPILRKWDVLTSSRVNYYIANSRYVAGRIKNYYNRTSEVIHPPVDSSTFQISKESGDYYLVVSALVPYKKNEIVIEAFNKLGKKLLVVGTGPEEAKLKSIAQENCTFLGWKSNEELAKYYAGCKALLFPGIEDFGIVPLEAMACGKPVIAFANGGALETVVDQKTGIYFFEQNSDAIVEAVLKLEQTTYDTQIIREHAMNFSREKFKERIKAYIGAKIKLHS